MKTNRLHICLVINMGSTTPEIHACEPDSDTLKDPLMDIKKMHSVSSMNDLSTNKVPKETKSHAKGK